MTDQFPDVTKMVPITPPPELVDKWLEQCLTSRQLVVQAARWGADQELEACVNYVDNNVSGNKARTLRALRRPKPPSLNEVAELVEGLRLISCGMSAMGHDSDSWFVARAAYLLERLSPPQPIPVSERLPALEDCDAEGRCWCYWPNSAGWELVELDLERHTHWLSAHALPLPSGEVE